MVGWWIRKLEIADTIMKRVPVRGTLFLFAAAEAPVVFHSFLNLLAPGFHYNVQSKEYQDNNDNCSEISLFHHCIRFISLRRWV